MQDIQIQPTPNPNALKFILEENVKNEGKSSYRTSEDCKFNPLAQKLFFLRGIDQVLFFQNVITVSKFSFAKWDELEPEITKVIDNNIENHDPDFQEHDPEVERRANLGPELKKIEEILDSQIRPGLQGDGGDLKVMDYKDNVLIVKYQGACGTCPSATTGTLQAITSILQDQFNPEIEVYTAPDF